LSHRPFAHLSSAIPHPSDLACTSKSQHQDTPLLLNTNIKTKSRLFVRNRKVITLFFIIFSKDRPVSNTYSSCPSLSLASNKYNTIR
jgi:hypothetical protein